MPYTPEPGNVIPAYDFFVSQGANPSAAAGIVAGLYAESGLDPQAFNPAGGGLGAYGIGQFRAARQTGLFAEYGQNPSFTDELQYVWQELTGGGYGGSTILADTNPQQALSDFINKFEIPGPAGASSDINRGQSILNELSNVSAPAGNSGFSIPSWAGDLLAPFQDPFGLFGTSTLVSPNNQVGTGVGIAQVGQQAAQAVPDIGAAVSAGVSSAVKPLTDWLSGLTSTGTVTRVAVGLVAIILLMAGIFFLASSRQTTINLAGAHA